MTIKLTTAQAKVQAGQQLQIKGILQYSSLTKKSEIKSKIQQAPAYSVTISNPQFVGVSPSNQELATFLEGQIFQSPKHGDLRLTLKSTGHIAPKVFDKVVRCAQGVVLQNELASGQEIAVIARAFKPKNFDTIGVALNAVLIEDANNIQYYNGGGVSLSAFGLEADPNAVYTAPTTPVEQFAGQQPMNQGAVQQPAYQQQMQQGGFQQQPMNQGAVQQPAYQQPMQQNAVQQPAYQQQMQQGSYQQQPMNQGAVQQPSYEQQMQQSGFQQPSYENADPFSQPTPFDEEMPF